MIHRAIFTTFGVFIIIIFYFTSFFCEKKEPQRGPVTIYLWHLFILLVPRIINARIKVNRFREQRPKLSPIYRMQYTRARPPKHEEIFAYQSPH